MSDYTLHKQHDYLLGQFTAMVSPCEVLVDTLDDNLARSLIDISISEAHRIEHKFSRYRSDNIIYQINHSQGKPVAVDEETASLLDYAQQCYEISDGLFDITSGVLRKIWTFDGGDNIATQEQIDQQLKFVGWKKVQWSRPEIVLPEGMEIDFGGIGKEYAVDQSIKLISEKSNVSCLVNYGGDIRVTSLRSNGKSWVIGVENPDKLDSLHSDGLSIKITSGAIATSGDTRKFLLKDGIRYGHVINPKTGWPVTKAPRSITVAANTCTEAGILATLALLQEEDAEKFLSSENVTHWCNW